MATTTRAPGAAIVRARSWFIGRRVGEVGGLYGAPAGWQGRRGASVYRHAMRPEAARATRTPRRVAVAVVGPVAGRALGAGAVTPLATFARALYVAAPGGGIACIGDAAIGAGPLNALIAASGRDRDIVAALAAGPFEVDLSRARRWTPPAAAAPAGAPRRGLAALGAALAAARPDAGLGPLLPSLVGGGAALPHRPGPLLRAAAPGVAALGAWLATPGPVPEAVLALIGLGPGLTPSGDDLLGGCLIALRRVGRHAEADALAGAVLARAGAATGRISRAHLGCAARGWGAAALHEALETILAGGEAHAACAAVARIGHGSGWDALVGVVLALRGPHELDRPRRGGGVR